MTDKQIKNEQWTVKTLIAKITKKEIIKPKFQRKKKWNKLPKNNNTPNNRDYIKFLYDTENSVHAITFGQESNSECIFFSNIDGNNRINAIKEFIDKPFEIFNEYLDDLNNFIDTRDLNDEDKNILKNIFYELSYNKIMNFKYNKYFSENGYKDLYDSKLKIHRDDFEPYIEKIQKQLRINENDNFDTTVRINVNLFEGYNTNELCKTFEDINKYNSQLTETELLSCRLYNIFGFTIKAKDFETNLKECIEEYYKDKAREEVLDCYIFNEEDNINAYDFIVGFQNLCNKKYDFISKTDVEGLSLFFKLWKTIYNGFNNFTTENINNFIENVIYSCDILQDTKSKIFNDKINEKLFNKSCCDKFETLKKNNLLMLICSIISFKQQNTEKNIIIKNIEKCLVYHFFVSDIKDQTIREEFRTSDPIRINGTGGSYIENTCKTLLSNPENISSKLNQECFDKLINHLFSETNLPYERKLENGKNKNDKRRKLRFYEKTLMFYYYKEKIPTNMLDNNFSIEHIIPNSSEWEEELDKDRTGNQIPIIARMNNQRLNKHISSYRKDGNKFCEFIKDIIPNDNIYDKIINHEKKKPKIINNKKYNEMCKNNENTYKENFIKCLF